MEDAKIFFAEVRRLQEENAEQIKETGRIVKETALQMKETDRKMQETDRKMQETDRNLQETDRIVKETALQMKETDRKMQETDRNLQETDRIVKETALQMKETDRKMQETDRNLQETDRIVKETALQMKETEQIVEKFGQRVDRFGSKVDRLSDFYEGTSKNLGYAAETYFQSSLSKTLLFCGIQFDELLRNLKKENKKGSCEFDIVLLNHVAAAVIEVKHRVHPGLVQNVAEKKSAEFRQFFPEYNDKALYLGVAGMSMDDTVLDEAMKYGIGVLKQTGNEIETLNVPLKAY